MSFASSFLIPFFPLSAINGCLSMENIADGFYFFIRALVCSESCILQSGLQVVAYACVGKRSESVRLIFWSHNILTGTLRGNTKFHNFFVVF